MQLNCKVTQKWQPPLFRVILPFQQNICYSPQVTQFLEGPTPPPFIFEDGLFFKLLII